MKEKCNTCGKVFDKWPSTVYDHNFCSRSCAKVWTSKHMHDMNEKMNAERMTPDTRAKLSLSRINTGDRKGYLKLNGRHAHRAVAEMMLGRPLRPGEVVHHIDENNDPSNLMVFPSQAEHAAWHAAHRKEVVPHEVHTS
jgi:endogenous inhibitor of DNA gyrase (YacG/DUF329 family)